jgi:hypothetical protein
MSNLTVGLQMAVENAKQGNVRSAWLLEVEIEQRGLIWQYIEALYPEYHSFEGIDVEVLFQLIHAQPERRARAFLQAIEEQADARP